MYVNSKINWKCDNLILGKWFAIECNKNIALSLLEARTSADAKVIGSIVKNIEGAVSAELQVIGFQQLSQSGLWQFKFEAHHLSRSIKGDVEIQQRS